MSVWRVWLAGVPLSIASFFSVGNFVLMVIVGLYGAAWLIGNRRLKSAFPVLIAFIFGSLSVWIAYAVIYGVNPLEVIATGSRLAFESTTGNRTYGTWLIGNLQDFAVFLGGPIVAALMAGAVSRLRKSAAQMDKPTEVGATGRMVDQPTEVGATALVIAAGGALLALIVSGIVRGEVGRLWMYFGPLLALLAARVFTRHSSLLIALLALQLLVMNTRWLVNDSYLDAPPERSVVRQPPTVNLATEYAFGDQIVLRGYEAGYLNHQIDLKLYWQALAQPPHAYTVFVHVLDASGQQVGQQDNMPLNNQSPTSCWQPGEYVSDPYKLTLSEDARGPFSIEVGLYRLETGERLTLSGGAATSVRLQVP